MHRQRVLVRVVILVLAVLVLFALRPLTFGDIALVIVLALAVWLVTALLERSPSDGQAAIDADDVLEAEPTADVDTAADVESDTAVLPGNAPTQPLR